MRWAIALGILLSVVTSDAMAAGRWIQCQSFKDAQQLLKLSYKLALHITNTGDRQCHRVPRIIRSWKDFSCQVLAENPGDLGRIISSNSLVAAQIVQEDPRDDRYAETPLGYIRLPETKQDVIEAFEYSNCRPDKTDFFNSRLYSNGVIFIF